MKTFELRLQDMASMQSVPDVETFVGEDRSGSFGLLAGHARFMTSLVFGLARFRTAANEWVYVALPGALLCFDAGVLTVSTRHFVMDRDYRKISAALTEQLLAEEAELQATKESLRRMEEEALKRMWRLGQPAV